MLAQSAEWQSLVRALSALVDVCGAENAFVIDAWGHLWCRALVLDAPATDRVLALARRAIDAAPKPLARGGRLRAFAADRTWYAASFGAYAVLVTLHGTENELAVRRHVHAALAEIEPLTLALPSPDGPEANEGARRLR